MKQHRVLRRAEDAPELRPAALGAVGDVADVRVVAAAGGVLDVEEGEGEGDEDAAVAADEGGGGGGEGGGTNKAVESAAANLGCKQLNDLQASSIAKSERRI